MPRPLHIVHIVPYFYPAWAYGGIPRLAYGLCQALAKLGHRITVFTSDALDAHRRAPPGYQRLHGIDIYRFPNLHNHLAYRHQGFLPLGMPFAFTRFLKEDEVDIIHVHGHRHLPGILAHRLAQSHGIPLILTPNGTLPAIEQKKGLKFIFDKLMGDNLVRDAHTLIAVSRAELGQFRQAGVSAKRTALIFNGMDLEEFEAFPPRGTFRQKWSVDQKNIVLYLGKLTPRKGVDHLIRAMSFLGDPQTALVIAGNDMAALLPELKALAKAVGIYEQTYFPGLLAGEERLAALADADVLAYPSTDEIFGLVPFEGLLAGAPAVVGDDCGCGELVRAADAGLLVPYGDSLALSQALKRLLADPNDRAARVKRGQDYIKRHFSWDRIAPQTEAIYRRALGPSS